VPVVVLLGAPGAGKGTQAPILAACMDAPVLASGDLLRAEAASGSELGRKIDGIMRAGELVPDEIVVRLFLERLGRPDAASGAVLDGFPRTRSQAEALDAALATAGRRVDRVIQLDVPIEELVARFADRVICKAGGHVYNLKSNPPGRPGLCDVDGSELVRRADDDEATVRARMEQQLAPLEEVAEHFRAGDVLQKVDGTQSIDRVAVGLLTALRAAPGEGGRA
jgi:adenylate kinase